MLFKLVLMQHCQHPLFTQISPASRQNRTRVETAVTPSLRGAGGLTRWPRCVAHLTATKVSELFQLLNTGMQATMTLGSMRGQSKYARLNDALSKNVPSFYFPETVTVYLAKTKM